MKLVFALLLLASAAHAQDSDLEAERARLLFEMMRFRPDTFILRSGANMTIEVIDRVRKAAREVIKILRNGALTFLPTIPDFATWTQEEEDGRYGIFGFLMHGRQDRNTRWNYTYVNYVKEGKTSPVKNQGKCGSCYAFGAISAIEAQQRVAGIGNDVLSEQQIVDCSYHKYDNGRLNMGCVSGTSLFSMQYANETVMALQSEYRYTEARGECKSNTPRTSGPFFNYTTVLPDNEDHLAYLLNKNGPLVVYIKVAPSFNYYSRGIYNDVFCRGAVNHAMVLSGLEKDAFGREYWILKNSWGPKWGDQGYIKFLKGRNICEMITNNVTIARYGEIITQ